MHQLRERTDSRYNSTQLSAAGGDLRRVRFTRRNKDGVQPEVLPIRTKFYRLLLRAYDHEHREFRNAPCSNDG